MKAVMASPLARLLLLVLFLLGTDRCQAAGDFYREFTRAFATNGVMLGVRSIDRALVDTNNTSPKLANASFTLTNLLANGQVGRVRLGMTMDEVVSEWGKPRWLYGQCFGGHRLSYSDCVLTFRSNCLFKIGVPRAFSFDGISAKSSLQDWTNVFGLPNRLETNRSGIFAGYEARGKRHTALVLRFDADGSALPPPDLYLDPVFTNSPRFVESVWERIPLSNAVFHAAY